MARLDLQPKNATRLEKAVSQTIDRLPELNVGVQDLRGFKYEPADPIVPYLVLEYGLTEVADYLPDLRAALAEGVDWQRIRGTIASVHKALNWIGADGIIEENSPYLYKWWWFQIHLPTERRSSAFVTPMIALANASKPLRSEFARVTAGFDVRAIRTNVGRLNRQMLNSWSGVRRAPGEPVLSFRYHHTQITDYPELGIYVGERKTVRHALLVDAAAPTEQRSGFPSSLATKLADASAPSSVPFSNAPWGNVPFGVPSPTVQTGY